MVLDVLQGSCSIEGNSVQQKAGTSIPVEPRMELRCYPLVFISFPSDTWAAYPIPATQYTTAFIASSRDTHHRCRDKT